MAFNSTTTAVTASMIANAYLAIQHAGTDAALTSEQAAALKTELTADPGAVGYKGADGAMKDSTSLLLILVNGGSAYPNPEPQGTITVEAATKNDFAVFMGTAMGRLLAGATDDAGKSLLAKWQAAEENLLPFVSLQDNVPLTSVTVSSLIASLVTDGVVTQEEADAFTHKPDPAWAASIRKAGRLRDVLGDLVPTPADIDAALAS